MSIRRHLTAIIAGSLGLVAIVISGVAFGVTKKQYDDYLTSYNKGVEEVKAKFAALPEEVFMDDNYSSSFANEYVLNAKDASVQPLNQSRAQEYGRIDGDDSPSGEYITGLDRSGGAITFSFDTDKNGMSDIMIALRTNFKNPSNEYQGYPNITDYIKIHINKLEIKAEDVELSNDREFHILVLKNTYLIQGTNTLTFTTDAYNPYVDNSQSNVILYIMPDIRNVTVATDVGVTINTSNDD